MFSKEVHSALENAGWSPGRKVPTAHWVSGLVAQGFTVLPAAIDLLESFGGLKIRPLKLPIEVYRPGVLSFEPVLAAESDRVEYWQKRLRLRLSPIAELTGGAGVLLAEAGRIFTCWDTILWVDGASFEDAMENTLVIGKRWPVEYGRMSEDA